ncbi:hypothetical protein LSUB1_G004932 [Lachnellula subtilissima]|uniref:Uncharacterized protein n=1 Tax=Lachnellula subtilissima TaxID=602034 RepID=A0A8H8UCG8_9HELO|nr:hypothetical protein LSUB1_G004932 [Lachnellula subtilissima]
MASSHSSPSSSQFSTHTTDPPSALPPQPNRSESVPLPVQHQPDSGFSRFLHRKRPTHISLQDWEHHVTPPYHDYIHQLVAAGWTNLQDLDNYMTTNATREGLVVSVLDIFDSKRKAWPDIYSELDLKNFMSHTSRKGVKVRFYMAEYQGTPSPALIETLGSSLNLDPRFFQWIIHSRGHIFTPSQRHNAPYQALGFGVLRDTTPSMTDAEKFKVMAYIQPDETGTGWTGIVLFSSCTKHNISNRVLQPPPSFQSPRPASTTLKPKSIRQLYLESFEYLDLAQATTSPFYATSNLFRINCFCWNQIITAIREQDRLINGISDTSVGHVEEIKRSLAIVQRGGSFVWAGKDEKATKESKEALQEDFQHLVEQTDLLWQTRSKLAKMRQSRSEARWTALTNAFTYLFAPITIISGIYGMNVSEISGSDTNPNIWQFFVAVLVFNLLMVAALSIYNFIQIHMKHGRVAGVKEVLCFAVGRTTSNRPKSREIS